MFVTSASDTLAIDANVLHTFTIDSEFSRSFINVSTVASGDSNGKNGVFCFLATHLSEKSSKSAMLVLSSLRQCIRLLDECVLIHSF